MFLGAANATTTHISIFLTSHGISILSDLPTIVLNEMIKRSKRKWTMEKILNSPDVQSGYSHLLLL